jgi:hypothetical protein
MISPMEMPLLYVRVIFGLVNDTTEANENKIVTLVKCCEYAERI